jgi:hypothetical protein
MKKYLFFTGMISLAFLFSCKKNVPGYTEKDYTFDASLPVATIDSGDMATFILTENPDVISFYSGEIGHEYINKERTVLDGGRLNIKFETRVQFQPADTLDVMLSNDFAGIYDSANVANAHWKRMTDLFLYPTPASTLSTFYPSGATNGDFTDITDSTISGHPFFLAFRYTNTKPTNIIWSVGKLGMYNIFTSGVANATVIDSNQITSGTFAPVQFVDATPRVTTSSTYLKISNSTQEPLGASYWHISRPLNPSAVEPDVPIVIKNISQSPLKEFKYIYTKPGTYKATFVAGYKRLNFDKTILKEFTVIVQ